MSAPKLPPLPEPVAWADRDGDLYVMPERQNWHPPHQMLYTADQMRQAQADAARAALEQAAKGCDDIAFDWHKHAAGGPVAAYSACADAIGALAKEIT